MQYPRLKFYMITLLLMTFLCSFTNLHAQQYGWSSSLHTSAGDLHIVSAGIEEDGYGNIYTAGTLQTQLVIESNSDTVTMPTPYGLSMFSSGYVIKYDAYGNRIWSYLFKEEPYSTYSGRVAIHDIEVDSIGDFYICGEYYGEIRSNLNGGTDLFPTAYNEEGFVAKYDPEGQLIWQIKSQGANNSGTEVTGIELSANGRLLCTGRYTGLGFGFPNVFNTKHLFIMGLNPNTGYDYWKHSLGEFDYNSFLSLKTDSEGSTILACAAYGLDFDTDSSSVYNITVEPVGLAKYNIDGEFDWAFGCQSIIMDVDADDNITYISHVGNDSVDVDPGIGVELATRTHLVKIDAGGNFIEVAQEAKLSPSNLRLDQEGNIHIIGDGHPSGDICPGPAIIHPDGFDMFYLKLAPDYTPLSFTQFPNDMENWSLSFDEMGNPLMVGILYPNPATSFDLDLGPDTAQIVLQGETGYVVKYFSCEQPTTTEFVSACDSYESPLNPLTQLTESGQYYFDLSPQNYPCDSVLILDLDLSYTDSVETSVVINQYTLATVANNADFQWFDCGTSAVLSGQTSETFTPLASGAYSVIVEQNGCVDTSDCVPFTPIACYADFSLHPDPLVNHNWFALDSSGGVPPLTYEWSWGDGSISTGLSVSHTYDTAGYYNICLSITDAIGCTDSYCDNSTYIYKTMQMVTVNVVNELPNGIEENQLGKSVTLYPNPTSDRIQIDIGTASKQLTVNAYNMLGELVQTETITTNGPIEYDMPKEKGVYLIQLMHSDGHVSNLKVVKE